MAVDRPFSLTSVKRPRYIQGVSSVIATLYLLCVALLCPWWLAAQAVTGSIVGTLTDSTGAAVPGSTIVVTDISKGASQTVQSNASGNYTVYRLIPDVYSIQATAKGFAAASAPNVTVDAGGATQVNLSFQVAGAGQSVTVPG